MTITIRKLGNYIHLTCIIWRLTIHFLRIKDVYPNLSNAESSLIKPEVSEWYLDRSKPVITTSISKQDCELTEIPKS